MVIRDDRAATSDVKAPPYAELFLEPELVSKAKVIVRARRLSVIDLPDALALRRILADWSICGIIGAFGGSSCPACA